MDTPFRDWLFVSRDHWEDGWTYGDWRQYIARRPDGSLQPCRISGVPAVFAMIGLFTLSTAFAGFLTWVQGVPVYEIRIVYCALLGLAMLAPLTVTTFTRWRIMTAVAPRSYDNRRHF